MIKKLAFTNPILILIGLMITLSSCSTWHYKQPRVSIDIERTNNAESKHTFSNQANTPSSTEVALVNSKTTSEEDLNFVGSASTDTKIKIEGKQHRKIIFKPVVKRKTINSNKGSFFQLSQKKDQLLEVKDVEKTALSGWLRIMIILFAVGLVLIIIGAIFSIVFGGGLWWLFYAIGSLCILAGVIVLILGLLGVM